MLFEENPFFILGVSPYSSKEDIIDAAETYEMMNDDASAKEMVKCLTNPIKRLEAELAWFYDEDVEDIKGYLVDIDSAISFKSCMEMFKQRWSEDGSYSLCWDDEELAIFYANFIVNVVAKQNKPGNFLKDAISMVAIAFEYIDEESLFDFIDGVRNEANIPSLNDINKLRDAMLERKNFFVKFFLERLQKLDSKEMIRIFTEVIEESTGNGERYGETVVYGLIDEYEKNTLTYFEANTPVIKGMITQVREAARIGVDEERLKNLVSKLIFATKQWDGVAQPIQVAAQSKGMEHTPSMELGYELRSLAVDLWNDYQELDLSIMITDAIGDIFKEVFSVKETADNDKSALNNLVHQRDEHIRKYREEVERRQRELDRKKKQEDAYMNYYGESGLVMKDCFTITPDSFTHSGVMKTTTIPLDSIEHIAWGTVANIRHGEAQSYDHHLGFMHDGVRFAVKFSNGNVFDNVINRLWRNPCNRLIKEMLQRLRNGEIICCGSIKFDDYGAWIDVGGLFSKKEERVPWKDTFVEKKDGCFYVCNRLENYYNVYGSYIGDWDTHLIDCIISLALKNHLERLSDLLE